MKHFKILHVFLAGMAAMAIWHKLQDSPFGGGNEHECPVPKIVWDEEHGFRPIIGEFTIQYDTICSMAENCGFNRHDPGCKSLPRNRDK